MNAVEEMANMVEEQPTDMDYQLLANEEVVKECIDYKNEADEDETYDLPHQLGDRMNAGCNKKTVSRKRKALKTLHNSKYLAPDSMNTNAKELCSLYFLSAGNVSRSNNMFLKGLET